MGNCILHIDGYTCHGRYNLPHGAKPAQISPMAKYGQSPDIGIDSNRDRGRFHGALPDPGRLAESNRNRESKQNLLRPRTREHEIGAAVALPIVVAVPYSFVRLDAISPLPVKCYASLFAPCLSISALGLVIGSCCKIEKRFLSP